MEAHCREFSIPDLDTYIGTYIGPHQRILDAEAEGQLDLTVAFAEGAAVGYLFWLLDSHPSFPNQKIAKLGPWHITPSRRGLLALRMFRWSLESLRKKGASAALATLPLRRTPPSHSWLRRLGGSPFEITWLIPLRSTS